MASTILVAINVVPSRLPIRRGIAKKTTPNKYVVSQREGRIWLIAWMISQTTVAVVTHERTEPSMLEGAEATGARITVVLAAEDILPFTLISNEIIFSHRQ